MTRKPPSDQGPAELLTAVELAARLRVSAATVKDWTREGLIPALRIRAKTIRYDFGEVCQALRAARAGEGRSHE